MLVSIVIPCYNSEHTIGEVVELAIQEFDKLDRYECEFVLVNDYSRDGTWNSICCLADRYSNVKGLIWQRILDSIMRSWQQCLRRKVI